MSELDSELKTDGQSGGIFLRFRRLDMPAFNPQARPALPVVAKEEP